MRIAIINCKKSKKTYSCPAEEMYSESAMFNSMSKFCSMYYDGYYILSAEYGLLHPTDIIAPYNKVIGGSGYAGTGESNVLEGNSLDSWATKVMSHPLWNIPDCEIEMHVSSPYLTPLLAYLPQNIKIHRLPNNTGFVVSHYNHLIAALYNNRPIDIGDIDYSRMAQSNKPKVLWYHPVYAPTGILYNQWDIHQKYNDTQTLDLPTLDMVDNGKKNAVSHHKGWCRRLEVLNLVHYDENRNQWRISKPKK